MVLVPPFTGWGKTDTLPNNHFSLGKRRLWGYPQECRVTSKRWITRKDTHLQHCPDICTFLRERAYSACGIEEQTQGEGKCWLHQRLPDRIVLSSFPGWPAGKPKRMRSMQCPLHKMVLGNRRCRKYDLQTWIASILSVHIRRLWRRLVPILLLLRRHKLQRRLLSWFPEELVGWFLMTRCQDERETKQGYFLWDKNLACNTHCHLYGVLKSMRQVYTLSFVYRKEEGELQFSNKRNYKNKYKLPDSHPNRFSTQISGGYSCSGVSRTSPFPCSPHDMYGGGNASSASRDNFSTCIRLHMTSITQGISFSAIHLGLTLECVTLECVTLALSTFTE